MHLERLENIGIECPLTSEPVEVSIRRFIVYDNPADTEGCLQTSMFLVIAMHAENQAESLI